MRQVFRQSDPIFVKILNEMRSGRVTAESDNTLRSLSRVPELFKTLDLEPTYLFPLRKDVERHNALKLKSISGQIITFSTLTIKC